MAKQFLDASGLNQYTKALKNGTLVVGDSSRAFYATHASALGLDGIIPLANLPASALDTLYIAANQEARLALTKADVQNGDTVQEADTKKLYLVVDDTKLGTQHPEDAFVEYTVGRVALAQDASHADVATKAVDASNAVNAQHAVTAQDASSADSVEWSGIQNKPGSFTPSLHTQDGSTITALTGYSKAQTNANVAATDSLLVALGKIEKKADDASAAASDHTHTSDKITAMTSYQKGSSYSPIETTDNLNQAIGKLEKLAVDSSVWSGIGGKPTEFTPTLHTQDASTITALTGYSKPSEGSAVTPNDTLIAALGKIEAKADAGADTPISSDTISAIVNGTFGQE